MPAQAQETASDKPDSIGLASGVTIGGAYKIIELLGRGGMGEVYLARHETLGKKCALKVIPPEQVTEAGWQRFQLEARTVAKLEHLNLVRVTDLGIHEGCLPFFAMDYVDGTNLAELLAENGPMPLDMVLEIFMQVCDGVDCAHRGAILHRDLKPANIMVATSKSGVKQAKVLDFGLAKLTGSNRAKQSLTAVGDVFGSPYYMSPEQCNGDKLDPRSDIYSLGCTMFECLTGRPPYAGHLVSAVIFGHLEADPPSLESIVGPGRLPASMEIVMAKLLRKNPSERYQNLVELRGDLEKVARGEDVQPVNANRNNYTQADSGAKGSATTRKNGESVSQPSAFTRAPLFKIDTSAEADLAASNRATGLLLISIGSVAVVAAGLIGWMIFSYSSSSDKTRAAVKVLGGSSNYPETITNNQDKPAVNFIRESFRKWPMISNGVTTGNGEHVRIFRFPETPLGLIIWGENGKYTRLAQGQVTLPAAEAATLQLPQSEGAYTRMFPSILTKIGPEDIDCLDIKGAWLRGMDDDGRSSEIPVELIRAISKWTALSRIDIYRFKMPNLSVLALDHLSAHIKELCLREAGVDGNYLAQVRWLPSLKGLDVKGCRNIDAVLGALSGTPTLKALWIDDTTPSEGGLRMLISCPNLETLSLSRAEIDDDKLAAVCRISSLRSLYLLDANLSAKALQQLTKLKNLRVLNLTYAHVKHSDVDKLKQDLPPGCHVQL